MAICVRRAGSWLAWQDPAVVWCRGDDWGEESAHAVEIVCGVAFREGRAEQSAWNRGNFGEREGGGVLKGARVWWFSSLTVDGRWWRDPGGGGGDESGSGSMRREWSCGGGSVIRENRGVEWGERGVLDVGNSVDDGPAWCTSLWIGAIGASCLVALCV